MRFVVAITAASGAIYARLTIERLLASPCVSEIALVCSRHAREVMAHEGVSLPVDTRIREYANDDMFIHLRNMAALTEAGAVILPASPSFYAAPQGVEELCGTVADRAAALLGVDISRYEWGK